MDGICSWGLAGLSDDFASISFSVNNDKLGNQRIGGLVLPEAGYSSAASEYDLRLSNTWTPNASLLHETRIGFSWKRTEYVPNSTRLALQVAGYFTGGGATAQHLNDRERDLEIDDDVVLTRGKHELKIGAQSLGIFLHNYDPNTFNGSYIFGGGAAPVLDSNNNPIHQTENVSPLEHTVALCWVFQEAIRPCFRSQREPSHSSRAMATGNVCPGLN